MVAIGFGLLGLGLGLIIDGLESTIAFLLVGLIVGALMNTKIGLYSNLKFKKTTVLCINIFIGIGIGLIVGYVINHFWGPLIMGIGMGILGPSIESYLINKKDKTS